MERIFCFNDHFVLLVKVDSHFLFPYSCMFAMRTIEAREARDEMDRFNMKGCILEVVFAQERRKSPNEMRGRVVNQQNHGRGRDRSSSFERHQKQRRRDEGRRNNKADKDNNGDKPQADRNADDGGDNNRKDREKSSDKKDGEE